MTLDELKNEIHSIFDAAKTEMRDLTDAENSRIEEIKKEVEELRNLEKEKENEPQVDEVKEDDDTPTESDDEKETPKNDEPKEDEKPLDDDKDKNKENRNFNIKMKEVNFSLVKELRSAMETGKKVNLNEIQERAYTIGDEGEEISVTKIWNPLESLYTNNQLVNAGARVLSGIKDNQQIPIMGKCSCTWEGEVDPASDGSGLISKVNLTPKRLCAFYPVSLQLLHQDSIGVENAIRREIEKAIADKFEATILGAGAGDANTPQGIFANTAITASNVSTFADMVNLEAVVETPGVDLANCKYVLSPTAKAKLRSMAKSTKSTQLVYENASVDGTPALTTAHVPANKYVFGSFDSLVMAFWSNVELEVVKDSAYLKNGQVVIIVNAYMDYAITRPETLAVGTIA